MKNELMDFSKSLVEGLAKYLDSSTKLKQIQGKGDIAETILETPFMLYDDRNITLRIRSENGKYIIHDNGQTNQYLKAYGLDLFNKKLPKKYRRWLEELSKRNDLIANKNYEWFFSYVDLKKPENILGFVECILSMSFLVLPKSVGMQPLSWKDKIAYEKLKLFIQNEFKDIQITPGITIKDIEWSNQWGLLLKKKDRSPVALQFLGGDTFQKIGENIMLTHGVFTVQRNAFGMEPRNCVVVFSGKNELFARAKKAFQYAIPSQLERQEYQFININHEKALIDVVKSGFENNPKKQIGKKSNTVINESGQLQRVDELTIALETNDENLGKAEVLEDELSLKLIFELEEKGRLSYEELVKESGPEIVESLSKLYSTGIIAMKDSSISLTSDGKGISNKLKKFLTKNISH